MCVVVFFFFQAEDGIGILVRSGGLGDVYRRQASPQPLAMANAKRTYSQYPGAISTPAERTASTKRDKLSDM